MKTGRPPLSLGEIIIVNGLPRSTKAPRMWPDIEPPHGRYPTYCNYGCRCQPCTADNTRYVREYRERKRPA